MLWPLLSRHADRSLGDGLEANDVETLWKEEKDRLVSQVRALDVALAEGKIAEKEHAMERSRLSVAANDALDQLRKARNVLGTSPGARNPRRYPLVAAGLAAALLVSITIAVLTIDRGTIMRAAPPLRLAGANPEPTGETAPSAGPVDIQAMVAGLEERVETGDPSVGEILMLARSYLVLDRADEAVALYRRAVGMEPENIEALMPLAVAIFDLRAEVEPGEAEALIDKVLALEPELPDAMWYKSLLLLQRGEVAGARAVLERLDAIVLDVPEARVAVQQLLNKLNAAPDDGGTDASGGTAAAPDIAEMVARLEQRVAEGDPSEADFAMLLRSYRALERVDEAAELALTASTRFPDNADFRMLRLRLVMDMTGAGAPDDEALLQEVEAALAKTPESKEARWYRATLMLRLDRPDAARSDLEWLAAKIDAENPVGARVRELLAELDSG
ncbi:MAG: tetratricopeptide repeat protein [Paracoccaceae bacterium]